jgi:hypothetical protein
MDPMSNATVYGFAFDEIGGHCFFWLTRCDVTVMMNELQLQCMA